jgi:hypothetical protein
VPTGTVVFTIDGTPQPGVVLDAAGQAALTTSALAVGPHTVDAAYGGSVSYVASNGSLAGGQTVSQSGTATAVTSSINPSTYGQTVIITATVTAVSPGAGVPTGTVVFTIDGTAQPGVALDAAGQATFTTASLTVGVHTVDAAYGGSVSYVASNGSLAGGQTVGIGATTTAVSSSANPSVWGETVIFTATVSPVPPASGVPTGAVVFTLDGAPQPAVPLNGLGQASLITSSLAIGPHTLTAAYSGSPGFTASSGSLVPDQQVNPGATTTVVGSSANPSVFGQTVTVTATVAPVAPAAGVPTGTVTFTIDGTPQAPVALNGAGQASISTSGLSVAVHSFTATYSGSATFLTSNGALNQTVNPADTTTALVNSMNPSVYGQSVTFTATVTPVAPGAGVPTGSVTFSFDGVAQPPAALNGAGQASISTLALGAGPHIITASYTGVTEFNPSNATLTGGQTVNPANTATSPVVSAPNPSDFMQPVVFSATVTSLAPGSGIPTGTVEFYEGAVLLGSGALDGAGTASLTYAALTSGLHVITATYTGSANYNPSNSQAPDLVHLVKDPPQALPQALTTPEDTPLGITLTGFDPSSNPLTFAIALPPAHGTLTGLNPITGAVTYTPALNYNGPDSFDFTVSNQYTTSAPGTITITVTPVNDQPIANAQAIATIEDIPLAITLTGDDGDPELAQPLTFAIATPPAHGTLSGLNPATGAVLYTPAADYVGPDSFTFTVTDDGTAGPVAALTSAPATVTITVVSENDAPVAIAQNVATGINLPLAIVLTATDTENQPLTYAVVTPPVVGALTGSAPLLTYTPPTDFLGTVSFTFTANDGFLASAPATVTITVTPPASFTSEPGLTPSPAVVGQIVLGQAPADTPNVVWNFGDGTQGSGQSVTHVYTQPGIYTVIITATSTEGVSSTYQTQIFVGSPVAGQSPNGITGGGATPPGATGIVVGGTGLASDLGSGKIVCNYLRRERTSVMGSVGTIAFPAGVTQQSLGGQAGILTLGTGPTAQTFQFTLSTKGRGRATSLPLIEVNLAKQRVRFKANNRPGLTDMVEALGGWWVRDTRNGPVVVVLVPATVQVGNSVFLAMTFQMEYRQIGTGGKGATGQ